MLPRRRCDLVRQRRFTRIILAHDPLQFRELINHLGGQIGLGHQRRRPGLVLVSSHQGRNLFGQIGDAFDPLCLRPQLIVKRHIGQRIGPGGDVRLGDAQVILPKELGIRQTRRQNLLVPRQNRRTIVLRFPVRNGHKMRDPARLVLHAEKLLMFLHRGLQNLCRQLQKIRANRAHQNHRPFDQPGNLGQKPLIFNNLKTLRKGHLGRVMPNRIRPFFGRQDNMGRLQLGLIIIEPRHPDRARRHKPMPLGRIARFDPVDLQINHRRPRLVAEHTEDRMQRSHPFQTARSPSHGLRPWKIAHGMFQNLGHDFIRRTALPRDHRKPDLTLLVVARL